MKDEIEKLLIEIASDVAKKNEGGLFVISDSCEYEVLMKQKIKTFSIFEDGANKILLSLAMIDGAVIISKNGKLRAYGAMIKRNGKNILSGKGTRHQAAISASLYTDSIAILISEEEKVIKVFKNGKVTVQANALSKDIKRELDDGIKILESLGFSTFTSLATTTLAGMGMLPLGIAITPSIIIFGVPYYLIRRLREYRKVTLSAAR